MKTELVFKMSQKVEGFSPTFALDCKVQIDKTEGLLFLNYERRTERVVGRFENLRQDGELILADVELFSGVKALEDRFEYAIEGSVVNKNDQEEATLISVKGVGALMHSKF